MQTLNDYQLAARQYATPEFKQLDALTIGLAGECGEVCELVKRHLYRGEPVPTAILFELGDVLWHIAGIASTLGLSLADVAVHNIGKLELRRQDGEPRVAPRSEVSDV